MAAKTRKTTTTKAAKKPAAKAAKTAKPAKKSPAKTSKPPKAAKASEAPKAAITQEMIAERAYHIWVAAGRPHGQDHAIWLLAEAELRKAASARTR